MTEERPTSSLSSSVTDGTFPWCERNSTLTNDNTTADSQLLLLLKTLHDETLSNWTGSFDDPSFDYLNIPLVKV